MSTQFLRLKIIIRGAVQGVGFRPFVFRLATEMKLCGWVSNTSQGVLIEVEGEQKILQTFLSRINSEKPKISSIYSCESSFLFPKNFTQFEIKESFDEGEKSVFILPDIATCEDCLKDIFDLNNRRYMYPFTNCTNCGPRFTIIQSLPYDRKNTTMSNFKMCDECEKEYHDPTNRRFHAQPNACAKCGPNVDLWNPEGKNEVTNHDAILRAVNLLLQGKIIAVKGLGGFHLMCDARNDDVVKKLRSRKHREEKPFAVMFQSLSEAEKECEISEIEKRILLSPESPIVLLKKINKISNIASSVAPQNPFLGVMLPYTPFHHILLSMLKIPIVATSGNISDEPICTNELQAIKKLNFIADYFLIHNRPIERYCDDSIVRIIQERELVLRRARGFAPLPIQISRNIEKPILAVGAHLKNTIALAHHNTIFVSQHIGDLETPESLNTFRKTIQDFQSLYKVTPSIIAHDLHPTYVSTTIAKNELAQQNQKAEIIPLQHHFAHIASCMAENELTGSVLGFSWDGTGYGTDGKIWGGESVLVKENKFSRVGTIRSFKLPGGESAVREPRRCAVGILYEIFGDGCINKSKIIEKSFNDNDRKMIIDMILKDINSPTTTSIGRIFDAVGAMLGVRMKNSFEGQAAMEVEFLAYKSTTTEFYPISIIEKDGMFVWNWETMFTQLLKDVALGNKIFDISKKFHNTLSMLIVEMAKKIKISRIVLSGGCFQNKLLLEQTIVELRKNDFTPYWHQRIPTNDGGISLGQVYANVM